MVCTDGWIEDSFCINENGYLTRHHDSWKHDWKYWADYLNEREEWLSAFYYNPTWISGSGKKQRNFGQRNKYSGAKITDLSYVYNGKMKKITGDRFLIKWRRSSIVLGGCRSFWSKSMCKDM